MKIVVAYYNRKNRYKKLLKVFMRSIKKVMPKVRLKIIDPRIKKKFNRKNDITESFLATANYAMNSNESLIIADVDLLFLKKVNDVFKKDFDIAITVRGDKQKPYNTGIWFYKPTEQAKRFIKLWIRETERLIEQAVKTKKWIFTHGGVDQMSLNKVLHKNENQLQLAKKAKILKLPCLEWNACQTEWDHVNKKTRVIHIKSKLRDWALKGKTPREHLRSIKKLGVIWRSYL